ncbi:MAG: hypothetical protein KO463_00070 [Candidatus Methanofastidiosa archaeon]|jgi:hypothetical protein|nr:hypothetical protein [Candidatus Methanofastidiosa archaeon]
MDMTPEEIEETDRQNIRRVFELIAFSASDAEVEKTRIAMLKTIALKEIAANALVEGDEKDPVQVALYTVALSNLI